jgi:arginyl-tRNA synthetase
LDEICEDLKKFNITFDKWFSEKTLHGSNGEINKVDDVVKWMREKDFIYEKDDALWLKATAFNDEKDRVVKRGTGVYTYLASDIAYHRDKIERGYKLMVDVWGADHHGYVPRLKAAIGALGYPDDMLKIVLVQLVNLKKGGEIISMSTRSGKFTCLSDLLSEVGSDATRFFFLTRSSDAQLEFDVDLATKNSSENPVYYVQYAYARIGSIFRQAAEQGVLVEFERENMTFEELNAPDDLYLIKKMLAFPDLIERMAKKLEPHLITHYIHDLVSDFHSFYNKHRVISDDIKLTSARLMLLKGVQIVIKNSLNILGVSAPEKM